MLALQIRLHGDVVTMTASIRKRKSPITEASLQKDIETENTF